MFVTSPTKTHWENRDYTMADDVKCHELTDVARQLSKRLIEEEKTLLVSGSIG